MKKIIFLLVPISLFLFSCGTDSPLPNEIVSLEKEVDKTPTPENIKKLTGEYIAYIKDHPEDEEWNGRLSYRAASRSLQGNNNSAAIRYLEDAVRAYPKSSATPNNLYLLAETYRNKFKQEALADRYYQALIEGFPNHEYAAKSKENIKKQKTLNERAVEARAALYADTSQVRLDPRKAKKLVDIYGLYTSILPNEANTPQYLYETYDIANSVRMYKDAAAASEKLYTEYPDFEKAPTAMFLTAFIYENHLRDLEKAEAIYKKFIAQYPNDSFAKDAQGALDNLGLPADQMLKNILEKANKEGTGGETGEKEEVEKNTEEGK